MVHKTSNIVSFVLRSLFHISRALNAEARPTAGLTITCHTADSRRTVHRRGSLCCTYQAYQIIRDSSSSGQSLGPLDGPPACSTDHPWSLSSEESL
ncbi:hypothetical protein PoB_001465300 [Plakobranchus ocellatus]|uniref:Secreted protein n=1 Tax=Plakobranchus ocellatus TaxID=259542 RepID=A0AAV3Z0V8_9GAST|nr:hypothetical protein PoB_001465300 [Plakobranchus ocellatus]